MSNDTDGRVGEGTCDLCGQRMLAVEGDAWHPFDVARACPPEPSIKPYDIAGWSAFFASGLHSGRPGRGHFVPTQDAS